MKESYMRRAAAGINRDGPRSSMPGRRHRSRRHPLPTGGDVHSSVAGNRLLWPDVSNVMASACGVTLRREEASR